MNHADVDGHACPGDDCGKITVTAEKTKEPGVISSSDGSKSTAILEGEVTYTFKYGGKPMANAPIHEEVSNKDFRNGKQEPALKPTTRDDSTDKNGQIGDVTTIERSTSVPSLPGTNMAEQILTSGDYVKQTTQTLTTTSKEGYSCSVTETRTLSIKDGDPSLTLHSPETQSATRTPPPPAKPPSP